MAEGGGETQIRFGRQRDDAFGLTNEDDLFITKIAISFGTSARKPKSFSATKIGHGLMAVVMPAGRSPRESRASGSNG